MTRDERLKRCEGCDECLTESTLILIPNDLKRDLWGCKLAQTLCAGVDHCPAGKGEEDEIKDVQAQR